MPPTPASLPPAAILNNNLSATAFRVLLYLANNATTDRTLQISQQDAADALGAKLRDVQQAFLQLQEEGFIDWKNKGSRVKSAVRLLWTDAAAPAAPAPRLSASSLPPSSLSSTELDASQANIPTQALSRAAIETAAANNTNNANNDPPTLADGTPRFVPPLPSILARIDFLEEQNEALNRQSRDLTKRLDQQTRLLSDIASHLKVSIPALPSVPEAAPNPTPASLRRANTRTKRGGNAS